MPNLNKKKQTSEQHIQRYNTQTTKQSARKELNLIIKKLLQDSSSII